MAISKENARQSLVNGAGNSKVYQVDNNNLYNDYSIGHSAISSPNCSSSKNITMHKGSKLVGSIGEELKLNWLEKKQGNILLADILSDLKQDKRSARVRECGSYLSFATPIDIATGELLGAHKLHSANFCRDRLCPMCQWRKSLKMFANVSKIMAHEKMKSQRFLFLTLTIPNVPFNDLKSTLDKLLSSFHRFIGYKRIADNINGWYRALEVTYNAQSRTFHPHLHIILAVNSSYFKKSGYIKHDEWLSLWQKATRDKSVQFVNIKVVKSRNPQNACDFGGAVAEVSKYPLKSYQYLSNSIDDELKRFLVYAFSVSLENRRLVAFGGLFKEIFQELKLQDVEDDNCDLVGSQGINPDLMYLISRYHWQCGAYIMTEEVITKGDKINE